MTATIGYAYAILLAAIICEVAATTALKLSDGMTKLVPALGVAVGYAAAFWLLSLTLQRLPLGLAYGLWSGIGTLGAALIGLWLFRESFTTWQWIGAALIIGGVILLKAGATDH
jgi:multidrug transporter EmrE-like cation transporter